VPEEAAGPLSKLFFAYANGLVRAGAAKHLDQADLWGTAARDEPQRVWAELEGALAATATPAAPRVRLYGVACQYCVAFV
jgi:hypothetical protein